MASSAFDPNNFSDTGDQYEEDAHPPWFIDWKDEVAVLDWSNKAFNARREMRGSSRWEAHANLSRWNGYYYGDEKTAQYAENFNSQKVRVRWPRVGINQTRVLVEQKIAKINNITPQTDLVPANSEPRDKTSAVQAKKVLDTIHYHYNMKSLRTHVLRRAALQSEGYLYINWNEDIGDPDKGYESAKKNGPVFLLDENGKKVKNQDGEFIEIKEAPRIGDVDVRLVNIDNVDFLLMPGIDGPFPYGVVITEPVHIMELKHDYPELADELEAPSEVQWFDEGILDYKLLKDHIVVHRFYIRSCRFFPNGKYWKCTHGAGDSAVLLDEPTDNPIPYTRALETSELGNLPIVRLTGIDIEGHFHATTVLSDISPLQRAYDKLFTFMMRNIWQYAHPKYVTPRGGVNLEQLASGATVIQASGPFQPYVMTPQVITQDIMNLFILIPEIMGTMYSIFQQSMGKAPKGARSAQQLMIYDEQEEEARGIDRDKLERFAVEVDAKILAIVSKYYDKDDARMYRTLGENKEWVAGQFDVEDLRKDYVVRVKNSTLFSDDKQKRVATLIQLKQMLGPELPTAQFLEAIDFGQHDRVLEIGRVAVIAAQYENEAFKTGKGKDVLAPEPYEDLITHWTEHSFLFYDKGFKNLPKSEQNYAKDHQMATEYLMYARGHQNPAFMQRLLMLTNFPMFYVEPEISGGAGVSNPAAESPTPTSPMTSEPIAPETTQAPAQGQSLQ